MSHPASSGTRFAGDATAFHAFASTAVIYLLSWTLAAVVGFPLFWMLLSSFKGEAELYVYPPTFFPADFTFANYVNLFRQTKFLTYLQNSLIVGGGATILSLLIGSVGAYTLSRFQHVRFIRIFAQTTLLCYMLPEVLLVIPLYVYVLKAGLANTLFSLVIANTAFTLPLTLWFMRSYFAAIPVSIEESAMIDGCTRLGALIRVVIPLALPGIVSVGIFSFNHAWNEYLFALVFTSSEEKKVLTLGLASWISDDHLYSWGMLLAGGVLVSAPVVTIFMLVERKLISGLSEGAAKGD